MSVDVSHFVLETPCDADNQVVNNGPDGSERSYVLASTMVKLNVDDIL